MGNSKRKGRDTLVYLVKSHKPWKRGKAVLNREVYPAWAFDWAYRTNSEILRVINEENGPR